MAQEFKQRARHSFVVAFECCILLLMAVGMLMSVSGDCSPSMANEQQHAILTAFGIALCGVVFQRALWPIAKRPLRWFADWTHEPESLMVLAMLCALGVFWAGMPL